MFGISRNNKPLDLGLSLRLANVSLNSELYLKFDPEKSQQKNLTILIQYSDKLRKIGEFQPDQTLWQVIQKLFTCDDIPELNDCDQYIFSINCMNKQVISFD